MEIINTTGVQTYRRRNNKTLPGAASGFHLRRHLCIGTLSFRHCCDWWLIETQSSVICLIGSLYNPSVFQGFCPLLDSFYRRRWKPCCYEIKTVLLYLILRKVGLLISGRFHLRIWTTGGHRRVREQVHTALHYSHN